jgi:CHAT domain-containing protein
VYWHHKAKSPRDRASDYRARITGSLVAESAGDSAAADLGQSSLTELRPGQVGNAILQPLSVAFDVLVRGGAGFAGEAALPGMMIIAPADLAYRKLNLGLYMTTEVRAGFVSWSVEGLATDGHVTDCDLVIDGVSAADDPSAPGGSLRWYTSPGHCIFASAVRCEFSYDPAAFTLAGTLSAVSADGQRFAATLSGERRGREAEELRHRLARSSLAGNWTGVLGPVGGMSLPSDSGIVALLSADPDGRAAGPVGQPKLIRLAIGPGLAIGLTWSDAATSMGAELFVLARSSSQFGGLEAIGPDQRTELKSLAYALEQDARYAEGLPVGRHAAHLYALASDRPGAWTVTARSDLTSAMRMVLTQLSCALALGNYPLMLTALTEAIDYARRSRELARADTSRSDRASLAHPEIPIRSLEAWRGRLDEDADRIAAVTMAGPFYALLAEFFNEQAAPGDALVAAELGRARAFADLLHETPWSPTRLFLGSTPRFTGTRLGAVLASLEQTVVEYQLHDDHLLIWVATPAGDVRSVPMPSGAEGAIPAAVARYQELVKQNKIDPLAPADRAAMDAVLTELGELLWGHIPRSWLPHDPDQVITVVPHGAALRAPFPALRAADGSYLIERHAIALSPALALLPELIRRHELAQAEASGPCLLAIVDPWPLPGNPLPNGEPFSRVELIGQLFGEVAALYPDAEVRSGANATAAALLDPVGAVKPTVVHFGTHAVALEGGGGGSDPLDSFVALAPDPDRDHDGRLLARSVLTAAIPGDIVVLSACATGRGEITGDGVVGLSRAFLSSGPTTLVLTLCEVTEGASLELTYEFHRQLTAEQCRPALALARAQRDAIATATDPRGWSPFVLYGLG